MGKKKLEKILVTHQIEDVDFNAIVNENEGLIRSIVNKYWRGVISYSDLLAIAREGLYMAHLKFDATRGCKFSSFAYNYVRNEVLDAIINNSSSGTMSNTDIKDVYKINKIIRQYVQDHDEMPTIEEISKISGGEFAPDKIRKLTASSVCHSLDDNIAEDLTLGDTIAIEEDEYDDEALINKVKEMLQILEGEEKQVITYYYLNEITNMAEIARLMNTNANHINTVYKRAINRIKASGIRSLREERAILAEKLKKLN